jgi:putative lipoic acid-binding regulatory protein
MKKRPKIEYPCKWGYRVIGENEASLRKAASDVFKEKSYSISPSRSSKTGKYVSIELTAEVKNEKARDKIYRSLRAHPSVIIVI